MSDIHDHASDVTDVTRDAVALYRATLAGDYEAVQVLTDNTDCPRCLAAITATTGLYLAQQQSGESPAPGEDYAARFAATAGDDLGAMLTWLGLAS